MREKSKVKDYSKRSLVYLLLRKNYNIVIVGVGGQGLITLLKIIGEAARIEGYDFKSSELHGLSQRGGSVEAHIRFGKEIYPHTKRGDVASGNKISEATPRYGVGVYSPLVRQGGADLIISLEAQEALKACYYASKENQTIILVNDFFSPIQGIKKTFSAQDILKELQKFSQKSILIEASQICQKELKNEVVAGIYLLAYTVFKNILPLKLESIISAVKRTIPEKFLELNLKAFNLVKSNS